MNDIRVISRLAPISDADAARLVSDGARSDLAYGIMTQADPVRRRQAGRRRWLIAVPAAVAAGAVALALTLLGGPRQGIVQVTPAKAAPLAFIRHGHYIDVIVRDPLADARRYRAEFKAHHLDVTLKLLPASPSLVGTVIYFGGAGTSEIKVITARGRCFTGGGGPVCPVGLRIPIDFGGQADLVFGRAARPGERYESTVSATARGEVLHGLHIVGRHVSAVLAMVARRHVTVPVIHITTRRGIGKDVAPDQVPGRWFVYGADPWAPGQVLLWAGPTRRQHVSGPPQPAPVPTPSATNHSASKHNG